MSMELHDLYSAACMQHGLEPNPEIFNEILKEEPSLHLKLLDMEETECLCLTELVKKAATVPEIQTIHLSINVDTCKTSSMIHLLTAAKTKLGDVDFSKSRMSRDLLRQAHHLLSFPKVLKREKKLCCCRTICASGLPCTGLVIDHCTMKSLSMAGRFQNLQALMLDYAAAVTSLSSTCFQLMPKLAKLSMCNASVSNLWTTSQALLKLPCLEELRFQRCICCTDTGACAAQIWFTVGAQEDDEKHDSQSGEASDYDSASGSELDVWSDCLSNENASEETINQEEHETEVNNVEASTCDSQLRHIKFINQAAICYESYYREFMVTTLTKLKVLDNLQVSRLEKEKAREVYHDNFEFMSNNRRARENLVDVLKRLEIGGGVTHKSNRCEDKSPAGHSRTLCASKSASVWPSVTTLYGPSKSIAEIGRKLKPRQFEYHPKELSLMVVGTLQGELAVLNHEDDKLVAYANSARSQDRVLGLSWLNKDTDKFIAGSDNGVLELYSLSRMRSQRNPVVCAYEEFDQLTSVHVNSSDEVFLVSGYSKNAGLYDLATAKQLNIYQELHQEHINVVKFSHHSPSIFATSSFDKDVKMWDLRSDMRRPIYSAASSRGNVMLCFSPDDHFLLASAVDNEVRQYLAGDGRLQMQFQIAPLNSRHNYTRSYYMNGRDYVITGSCEENLVRVCCAHTGRRLRDLTLEDGGINNSLYVQSLRGDPFKDFHMCVLVAYNHPQQKSEIVKVNMLATSEESVTEAYSQSSGEGAGTVNGA